MKKVLSVILSVVVLLGSFSAAAFAADEYFASGVIVTGDGREFSWSLKREYGNLMISGEGDMPEFDGPAEWNQYNFQTVHIGEGITSISDEAFLNAKYLGVIGRVYLPEGLTKIGDRAFYGCEKLGEFDFRDVEAIGAMAFYGCNSLKEFFISEAVKEIGAYSIGYFCDEALDDEFAKIDGVKIYSYVNTPAHTYALENEIEFIDLNDYRAFFEYEMVDDESVMLTSFTECEYSKNITIPSVIDGFKVVALGEFLFENSEIKSVKIPASVNKIHATAFLNASELEEITVEDGGRFSSYKGGLYNDDLSLLYRMPEGKSEVELPDSLAEIGEEAFRNSKVNNIVLPESVSLMGEGAFFGSSLSGITLPEGLTSIPEWAFASCDSLWEIDLGNVTEIGDNAFRDCALSNVKFCSDLKEIGATAFYGTDLNDVVIPDTVEAIGEKAFGYYFENDVEFVKKEGFKVCGRVGSLAQSYAEENGFEFVEFSPKAPRIYYGYADTLAISVFWYPEQTADFYEVFRKTENGEYEKIGVTEDYSMSFYVDYDLKNGESYTYSVVSVKSGIRSVLGNEITIDYIKLETPEMKSAEMTREGIFVKWGMVEDAEGYSLYRRAEGGRWVQIAEFKGSVKSYLDATVESGKEYDYTVKAFLNDFESGYDTEGVSAMYLDIPELKKIENTSSGIKITWKKVEGADTYFIGRKTSKTSWEKIATVGDVSSYTDKTAKAGTTYYYTVVSARGDVKGFYDEAGLKYRFVSRPSLKSVTNASSGVKLTWGEVSKCSGYIVYRKTAGGSWERLKKITDSSVTSYTDKTAKSGTKYYYSVKAYNGSYVSTYKASEIIRLSNPKLVSVTSTKGGVKFEWGKVKGAEGYYVYRKTGSGSWKKLATIKDGATVSYLDKTAKKGVTYKYTVKAYSGSDKSYYVTKGLSVKDKY